MNTGEKKEWIDNKIRDLKINGEIYEGQIYALLEEILNIHFKDVSNNYLEVCGSYRNKEKNRIEIENLLQELLDENFYIKEKKDFTSMYDCLKIKIKRKNNKYILYEQ